MSLHPYPYSSDEDDVSAVSCARSHVYATPKLNTNDINISMRARIQIVPELWFSAMSYGLKFKLFDKQNVHMDAMYACLCVQNVLAH